MTTKHEIRTIRPINYKDRFNLNTKLKLVLNSNSQFFILHANNIGPNQYEQQNNFD